MKIGVDEIGFDFDGVIAAAGEAFVDIACREFDYCGVSLADITCFDVDKCLELPKEVVDAIFMRIQEDSLSTGLQPISGAVEALSAMSLKGKVHVITARSLMQPVLDWFEHYWPASVCERIDVVTTGDPDEKLEYLQEKGLKYFVDDRVKTCLNLSENGIRPFVYEQPWNAGRHNLDSVASWQQLLDLVDVGEANG